jgi:hypothetical protein
MAGRAGGEAGQVQPAGAVLDEYQDIQALQRDSVHREEVTCDDPVGLGGQELPPGRPGPARCRIDPGRIQNLPYRRGRDLVAKAGQHTLDTPMPPLRVVPRHPQDQLLDRRCC